MEILYLSEYDIYLEHPVKCPCTFCKIERRVTQMLYVIIHNKRPMNREMAICDICGAVLGYKYMSSIKKHKQEKHGY